MSRSAYYKAITRRVFWEADTTAIRVQLAWASMLWTIALWLPLHTFDRSAFGAMRQIAGEWTWGGAFLLHWAGVMWRTYDHKRRIGWALAINSYGIALWLYSSGMIVFSVGEFSPGIAAETVMILAAVVALIRTGLNDEVGSP